MTKVGVVIQDTENPDSYFCVLQRKYPGKVKSFYGEGIGKLFTDLSKKLGIEEEVKKILEVKDINNKSKDDGSDFTDVIIKPFLNY